MDAQAPSSKCNLPKEKVFSIQIGSETFRLSGASLASDGKRAYSLPSNLKLTPFQTAPSYFSRFFEDQLRQSQDVANIRTLYIDRDPATFREIARHLQGMGHHGQTRTEADQAASRLPCTAPGWRAIREAIRRCAVLYMWAFSVHTPWK